MSFGHAALACLAVALLALPASAQHRRTLEDMTYRPAARGPSTVLGGRFTAQRDVAPLSAARPGNVALLGARQFDFRRGPVSQGTYALGVAQVGMITPLGRQGSLPPMTWGGDARVMGALTEAVRLASPIPGMTRENIPLLYASQFTPRPDLTDFQQLMGLQPDLGPPPGAFDPYRLPMASVAHIVEDRLPLVTAQPQPGDGEHAVEPAPIGLSPTLSPDLGSRPDSLVHALQAQNDARIAAMAREAERDLKAATVTAQTREEVEQRRAALGHAMNRLRAIRELDTQNGLAPLLLVHAALIQGRPQQATLYLLDAVERDPQALRGLDGARYFGSPGFLDDQMRSWLRQFGSTGGDQPQPVLAAYCAWRLKDAARTRDALAEVIALAQEDARLGARLMLLIETLQQPLPTVR